jgi:hypothetical protein
MFWPKGGHLAYNLTHLPNLFFLTTFYMWLGLPHPSIACVPRWCAHIPSTLRGYLLHCPHGNERTKAHDEIHDTFANIARNVGFHMGRKQLHALISTTFNSSCWQINIVFTKDGILTLSWNFHRRPNVSKFISWSCTTQKFATFDATQAKEKNYHNQHPINHSN